MKRRITFRRMVCMLSCCRWPLLCALDRCAQAVRTVGSVRVTCGRGQRYCDRVFAGIDPQKKKVS